MELTSGVVAACTLLILWVLEAVIPGLHGKDAGTGRRVRHMWLGLLNAGVSALAVVLLLGIDVLGGEAGLGVLRITAWPAWAETIAALLVLDCWQYTCHVLMHKVPALWRLHAVHHHADRLEATVAMRFHTLEVLLHGLSLTPLMLIVGVRIEHIALYNVLLLPFSLFHHANIDLGPRTDRALRLLIVTPRMHSVHHSRWQPETDSNYSAILSIWDRLFGTMKSLRRPELLRVGLDGFRQEEISTVGGMLRTPFSASRAEPGSPPEGYEETEPTRSRVVEPKTRTSAAVSRV